MNLDSQIVNRDSHVNEVCGMDAPRGCRGSTTWPRRPSSLRRKTSTHVMRFPDVRHGRRTFFVVSSLAMVVVVGYVDYATSQDLSFSVFYLLALGLAACVV